MAFPGNPRGLPRAVHALAVLHGDAAQRGQRLGLLEHPFGEVRVHTHALPLSRPKRTALVPDRVRDTEAAEVVDEPGPAQRVNLGARETDLVAGRRGEFGDRPLNARACTAT